MSGSARFALALAVVLGSGGAVAQPVVPAAVATTPERSGHHPHAGLGAGLTVGLARSSATDDGWVARLDYDVLPVLAPRGTFGGVFGFAIAGELWKAGEDWGLGLPFAMALGVRGRGFRAVGLLGWETFLVDSVADDTGVGFLRAPGGRARRPRSRRLAARRRRPRDPPMAVRRRRPDPVAGRRVLESHHRAHAGRAAALRPGP
jgi:hypothetical protein